jgi:hypothetical protein
MSDFSVVFSVTCFCFLESIASRACKISSMGANGWRHAEQAEAARWLALAAFGSNNGIGIGSGSGVNSNSGASNQAPTPSGSGNGTAAVAVSASHADARYQLGLLFADGRGVRQSHGTATHCFRLAVEQARIGVVSLPRKGERPIIGMQISGAHFHQSILIFCHAASSTFVKIFGPSL